MRAARLRHTVMLQSPTETRDDHGQPIKTWTDYESVWAGIEPLRGTEYDDKRQEVTEATTRIVLRYMSSITTDWRILYGSVVYKILFIRDLNMRHKEMHLSVKEVE